MTDDVAGAVRRTPRPTPHPRPADDHQTAETVAQPGAGTTNAPTPVSSDAGNGTDDLSASSPEFQRGMMVGLERAAIALSQAGWTELSMWLQNCEIRTHTPGYPAPWEKPPAPDVVHELFGQGLDVHTTDDDLEAYAALPDCLACDGSGKDDHGTTFEAPLAVHFAGPPVEIEGRRRQLCMWCGHVLSDVPLKDAEAAWPQGELIRVEDGLSSVVPYVSCDTLPPGCCALPDDEEPADDGLCEKCAAPRTVVDPFGDRLCKQHLAEAYAIEADAERQADEQPDDDGPDEAQETRAAADWPTEPQDGDRD